MAVTCTITDVVADVENVAYIVTATYTDGVHTQVNQYSYSPDTPIASVQKALTVEGQAVAKKFAMQTSYEAAVAGGKKPFQAYIGTSFQVA